MEEKINAVKHLVKNAYYSEIASLLGELTLVLGKEFMEQEEIIETIRDFHEKYYTAFPTESGSEEIVVSLHNRHFVESPEGSTIYAYFDPLTYNTFKVDFINGTAVKLPGQAPTPPEKIKKFIDSLMAILQPVLPPKMTLLVVGESRLSSEKYEIILTKKQFRKECFKSATWAEHWTVEMIQEKTGGESRNKHKINGSIRLYVTSNEEGSADMVVTKVFPVMLLPSGEEVPKAIQNILREAQSSIWAALHQQQLVTAPQLEDTLRKKAGMTGGEYPWGSWTGDTPNLHIS